MAKRNRSITAGEQVIDSRDVISRIEELEGFLELDHGEHDTPFEDWVNQKAEEGEDDCVELLALRALAKEGEDATSEWRHGEALIHEDHWVEYCEELVKDIGDMPRDIPSYIEIDWKKTADNLEADYTTVEFAGETYYIRSS